jgi:SAM-dependent methyltransferase
VRLVESAPESVEAVGVETLLRMADVTAYNDWVYRRIQPYLGERLLEVGCGIGNMSGYYADRRLLVCLDLLPESLALVRSKLGDRANLTTVQGDVCADATIAELTRYDFDTAVMLNVLEHIEDDARALVAVHRMLAPGGRLVLLLPAEHYLYGTLDRALGHYRRYEPAEVPPLVNGAGFAIDLMEYMNLPGILGWFVNGRLLRRHLLPRPQLALFNVLAPLFEAAERKVTPPRGQSLVVICRKR